MIQSMFNFINSLSSVQKKIVASASVVLAILYYLYFIQFGLDLTDSFFHINYFIHKILDPTTFLSSTFGFYLSRFFGEQLIIFRLLYIFLMVVMQLLPFLLIQKEKRLNYLIFFFPFSLLIAPTMFNYLSYDTFTVFFLTLYIVVFISYLKKNKVFLLFFLSIIAAILIGLRLPNILLLIFTSFIFFLHFYYNKRIMIFVISTYLVLTIVFYVIIILSQYKNIQDFFSNFNYFIALKGESHGFFYLIKSYLYDVFKILFFITISSFIFISSIFKKFNKKTIKIIGILMFLIFYIVFVFEKSFAYRLGLFLNALLIFICLFDFKNNLYSTKRLFYLSLFLFSFVPALGSDTGLHKSSFIFVFLPFVFSISDKINYKFILLLVLILPISIFQRFNISYNDVSPIYANAKSSIKKIQYIQSSTIRIKEIEAIKVDSEMLTNRGYKVLYYGVKSHILNYLFFEKKPVFIGYFQNINSDIEFTKLEAIASQNKIAILIYNNPKNTQKTTVHNLLLTKGFYFYTKEQYIIYFKD